MRINRRSILTHNRTPIGIALLLLCVATGGWDACRGNTFIKSFRVALAASGPLTSSLNLPVATVARITKDFDDGAVCAGTLQNAFSLIPKDDPDATSRKLTASVVAMRCWRVVVNRQNFAAHPRIQQAANIADGILSSLVVFYSEPGEMRNEVGRARTISARDEGELEKKLKEQVKELERALKP